mgnify:CR=1 FL=1
MQSDQNIIFGVTFIIFQTAEAALLFRAFSQSHNVLHRALGARGNILIDLYRPGVFLNHKRIMITSLNVPIRMSWLTVRQFIG